jgi:hypothetical protein
VGAEEVWQPRDFVYTAREDRRIGAKAMPIFSQLMFRAVQWAARRGVREEYGFSSEEKKLAARRTGVRGETYAYWYLRRQGYIFVARNYTSRGVKGELDLVGYDGKTQRAPTVKICPVCRN